MKYIIYAALAAFMPLAAFCQKIIFKDDYQAAPVFSSDPSKGYTNWDETCCAWSFTNSDSFGLPIRSGRFELRKSDPSPQPNDSKRSQMEWNGAALKMGAVWYAMSIMPAPYSAIDPAPEDLFDLHDKMPNNAPSNWTNPFGIWNENGRWKIHITYSVNPVSSSNPPVSKYYDLGPVVPGKFVDWILHTNYSWRDTGYVELYKDGVKVIDYKGPCAYNGAMPDPYFKFGIYKWPWASSTFQPPSTTTLRVFYVDNFRVGNRNATLADILLPASNASPIANAGPDQTTAPGATAFTLSGSGTDADGVISSYSWRTFLTPTGWMGTSNSQVWNISGAIAGKYGYELTVTDDKAATGMDTCYVTIPALNAPPVISYISNDTYTLPISTANITVTAADADKDSLSYQWKDTTGAIVSYMPTFTRKFTTPGTFRFTVTITDSKGGSTNGTAAILVNPIPPKLILSVSSVLNPKTGGLIVTHYHADGTTSVHEYD